MEGSASRKRPIEASWGTIDGEAREKRVIPSQPIISKDQNLESIQTSHDHLEEKVEHKNPPSNHLGTPLSGPESIGASLENSNLAKSSGQSQGQPPKAQPEKQGFSQPRDEDTPHHVQDERMDGLNHFILMQVSFLTS